MPEVKRTLVKSGPELWAEVSDPDALSKLLEVFGPLRVVDCEPERCIEWDAELGWGSVLLEPTGFGTKVTLSALVKATEPAPVAPELTEELEAEVARAGFWARLFRRAPAHEPEAEPATPPEPEPALSEEQATAALTAVLDTLGAAHHRPFSRS